LSGKEASFLGRHGVDMSRMPMTWSTWQQSPAEGGFLVVLGRDGLGDGVLLGECPTWLFIMAGNGDVLGTTLLVEGIIVRSCGGIDPYTLMAPHGSCQIRWPNSPERAV
jgi:hypothetical protein